LAGEDEVRAEVDEIQAEHGHIELVLVADDPAGGLAEIATEDHAEAVVVGTRGRGGLHGAILGRVPVELLHRRAWPVIIVPHSP
jgi:nucleotide-binding universal stress UspA family protein